MKIIDGVQGVNLGAMMVISTKTIGNGTWVEMKEW
jgi:hypothetical protein